MADAGLRAGEVIRLLIEDWNPQERSLFVRAILHNQLNVE
jgi:hypothetical protein